MVEELRLEAFASNGAITPISMNVYELHSQRIENYFSIIRGATWKIRSYFRCAAFEDSKYIYTLEKLDGTIPNADFNLVYLGEQKLPVVENRKIYSDLITYLIKENLAQVKIAGKYNKYSCRGDITSKWLRRAGKYETVASRDKSISLERRYSIDVDILNDARACVRISTGSLFSSNLTINDYLQRGENPSGMEVKNNWSKEKQSGTVCEVCGYSVSDKLDFADSLKAYYINKGEGYRVNEIPDDTPAVLVDMGNGKKYPYYPHALSPILSREKVAEIDSEFSSRIETFVKRDMVERLDLDRDFIHDIGKLDSVGIEFNDETCPIEDLGFRKGRIDPPQLVCANNARVEHGKEITVFKKGFYKTPGKRIKVAYIYPEGYDASIKAVANAIVDFSNKGRFHKNTDAFTKCGLLNIQGNYVCVETYKLGDLTDYTRAATRLTNTEGIDIAIALVPNGNEEDDAYNPFKKVFAKANLPSQMISIETAELFANEHDSDSTSKFYLHNIVLGILGKTGGIPWVVSDMPGEVDCFVGLDVATVAKGIHYPACSVVFDKYGRLIGFYKPSNPQQGEKIATRLLQEIFDQVLISFEEQYGTMPRSIVIHRDGFSNEDDEWYRKYFGAKGIKYSIIEVRKMNNTKIMIDADGIVRNPDLGHCIFNDKIGYLVTTELGKKKGSPNPLLVEKKCGDLATEQILTQILYLSQLHVGSTHKLRLPITTGYADKICKNREYVPEGRMDNRLFFL